MKEITDLGLISTLIVMGYLPDKREKRDKQVVFLFKDSEMFNQICNDYFNHRINVDAFTFNTTIKEVKTSIYQLTDEK